MSWREYFGAQSHARITQYAQKGENKSNIAHIADIAYRFSPSEMTPEALAPDPARNPPPVAFSLTRQDEYARLPAEVRWWWDAVFYGVQVDGGKDRAAADLSAWETVDLIQTTIAKENCNAH